MTPREPEPAIGDTKDWTWAAERPCPECGFVPNSVMDDGLADALRATVSRWQAVLGRTDVARRPAEGVWSPLEYACHVRDVHRVFTERVALMVAEDGPHFPNWDQDEAAVAGKYWAEDPATVATELAEAAETTAEGYVGVPAEAWGRKGFRGDGGTFTVSSIGRYHLHDVVHHLYDVRG